MCALTAWIQQNRIETTYNQKCETTAAAKDARQTTKAGGWSRRAWVRRPRRISVGRVTAEDSWTYQPCMNN